MKILHLITSLKVGGAESSLINLLNSLDREENEHVVVYFHEGPNVAKLHALGVETYRVTGAISPYDPLGLISLYSLIKNLQPDLIHSALWSANTLGALVARALHIPLVCDLHGNVKEHGSVRNFFEKITASTPNKIVAVSRSVADSYMSEIMNREVDVIPNGIDVGAVRSVTSVLERSEFGIRDDDFVVGSVGRLVSIKAYHILIKSFSKLGHSSKKLILVGDGPEMASLKSLSHELGLQSKIIFTGQREDALSFYNLFDCFVLPSVSEGLSIAMLEAMSFGIPVVVTGINSRHDVVSHGETGLVVTPLDEGELVEALGLLCVESDLRKSLGTAGKTLVEEDYNIKQMAFKYEMVYKGLSNLNN